MGFKSSHWFCLKACCKGYTFCFTTFLARVLERSKAMNKAQNKKKKRSNDLKRSKFQQVQSFDCVHP
jgi:hypothetical protein